MLWYFLYHQLERDMAAVTERSTDGTFSVQPCNVLLFLPSTSSIIVSQLRDNYPAYIVLTITQNRFHFERAPAARQWLPPELHLVSNNDQQQLQIREIARSRCHSFVACYHRIS